MANNNQRKYLAKDFLSFRNELLNHAKIYFPNNIKDFSEASLGGLFLEMAAYVGDSLSYYMDHQFNELNYETAIETSNLEQHMKNAGVQVTGNAPAVVYIRFYARIPSALKNGQYVADTTSMPIIKKGTIVSSRSGIDFELIENLDFAEKDTDGNLISITVEGKTTNVTPSYYIVYREGLCISGKTNTESFVIPNSNAPYRELLLSKADISSIDKVYDSSSNEYYEVESLSQDTVFAAINNSNFPKDGVKYNLTVKSADRRFIKNTSINTRTTKIQFGAGSPESMNDDIITDVSSMALSLYGKKTISKFSIDPAQILQSKTLGIYPKNTKITVVYRYGGGASHNIDADSISGISSLDIKFNPACSIVNREVVVNSLSAKNISAALGGANAPTMEELRSLIPAARNMQNRVVTRDDLFARLYTLPAEFGRVYKASIVNNPNNPLASTIHIISRDKRGKLSQSPDTLKRNLSTYLNEFRLISDAYDILDAEIINFKISTSISIMPGLNSKDIANELILRIKDYAVTSQFELGQPIIESEIMNVIVNTPGILAIGSIKLVNVFGESNSRIYSSDIYNFAANKQNGIYNIPQNSIFELKYPNFDIEVTI